MVSHLASLKYKAEYLKKTLMSKRNQKHNTQKQMRLLTMILKEIDIFVNRGKKNKNIERLYNLHLPSNHEKLIVL